MELTKIDETRQALQQKLTEYKIEIKTELVKVDNQDTLSQAESLVKELKLNKKELLENLKPYKSRLDELKAIVLDKEKFESSIVDEFIKKQEASIVEYKRRILEEQRKAKEEAERKAREEAERLAKIEREKLEAERLAKQKELEALQRSSAPVVEKIDAIEKAREEIEKIESTKIPTVEITPEKVVLKKDEIKVKKSFFIKDEKAFIEYAIRENRDLIKIEIQKSKVNDWLKNEQNQKQPFIGFEEIV